MEFRLTFKEKEIRDIYIDSFEDWDKDRRTQFKGERNTIIVLICLTILTISLTSLHFDWIYYGIFFLLVTIIYAVRNWQQKQMTNKDTEKWKNDLEDFFKKYQNITDIKYTYDNDRIQYYEQGKLTQEIFWTDFQRVDKTDKWIYLYFKNPEHTIWLPRVTVAKEEMDCFERAIDERVQNVR
jgi:Ca2+/Na+ antiporter